MCRHIRQWVVGCPGLGAMRDRCRRVLRRCESKTMSLDRFVQLLAQNAAYADAFGGGEGDATRRMDGHELGSMGRILVLRFFLYVACWGCKLFCTEDTPDHPRATWYLVGVEEVTSDDSPSRLGVPSPCVRQSPCGILSVKPEHDPPTFWRHWNLI